MMKKCQKKKGERESEGGRGGEKVRVRERRDGERVCECASLIGFYLFVLLFRKSFRFIYKKLLNLLPAIGDDEDDEEGPDSEANKVTQ